MEKHLCFLSRNRNARTIAALGPCLEKPLAGHLFLSHAEKSHAFQSLLSARTGHPLTLVQDRIPS